MGGFPNRFLPPEKVKAQGAAILFSFTPLFSPVTFSRLLSFLSAFPFEGPFGQVVHRSRLSTVLYAPLKAISFWVPFF